MTLYDWLILVAVAFSVLVGARRGFVKEALSLGTWALAILCVWFFARPFAGLLEPYIAHEDVRLMTARFGLFVMVLAVGGMLGRLLRPVVEVAGLGSVDGFLGVCFGAARGLLVVAVVVAALHHLTDLFEDDWWQESPALVTMVDWLERFDLLDSSIRDQGEQLLQEWVPALRRQGEQALEDWGPALRQQGEQALEDWGPAMRQQGERLLEQLDLETPERLAPELRRQWQRLDPKTRERTLEWLAQLAPEDRQQELKRLLERLAPEPDGRDG